MSASDIDLTAVNWQHGMLLTPGHFIRQEKFLESQIKWLARYCIPASGLVGNGIRPQFGKMSSPLDPVLLVQQDERELKIVVSEVRAISDTGQIFNLGADNPAQGIFPLEELAGIDKLDIYIIANQGDKVPVRGEEDENNPDMLTGLVQQYSIGLNLSRDSESAPRVLVARLVRAENHQRFEQQSDFIPPCAVVSAHSAMIRSWKKILEQLQSLAERSIELHGSIVLYLSLLEGKGIDLTEDRETVDFIGRLVVALEHCIYEILDPSIPPHRFLQEVYRLIRSSAVFLELSPPSRAYFAHLADFGESEFLPLVEQQLRTLRLEREWIYEGDLSAQLDRLQEGIYRMARLVEALGGKYLDYRISPSIESLSFVIDRDQTLFKAVSKIAHSQATADESTFVFARMQLKGREGYRIILIGDPRSSFQPGDVIKATVRINFGGGTALEPIYQEAICEIPGQKNFAIDFETREVASITEIRISIRSDHLIRSAMLYARQLLFTAAKSTQDPAATPVVPHSPRVAPPGIPEERRNQGANPARAREQTYEPKPKEPARKKYLMTDPGSTRK